MKSPANETRECHFLLLYPDSPGMSEVDFVDVVDPDEVFATLGDEIRIDILQALWEMEDERASFSELYDRADVDDSGQFNYHLNKLVGRFVEKADEGYTLTDRGRLINGAITAGAFTMHGSIDPITLGEPCPGCGDDRIFTYDGEAVAVQCDSCPVGLGFTVPPGVFAGYTREQVPVVASRYIRSSFNQIASGFCFYCKGKMEPTIDSLDEVFSPIDEHSAEIPVHIDTRIDEIPWVRFTCDRCQSSPTAGLDLLLLDHPLVADFYYDNGVDVRDVPIWGLGIGNPDRAAIRDRNPFRASVTYAIDGKELTLVVDDSITVVEQTRSP